MVQTTNASVRDVDLLGAASGPALRRALFAARGCGNFRADSLFMFTPSFGTGVLGCHVDNTAGVLTKIFSSTGFLISDCNGRNATSAPLVLIGGGGDEAGSTSIAVQNSNVNMLGVVAFGAVDADAIAVDVDSTSVVFADGCNFGRFQGYVGQNRPVRIAAGGLVSAAFSTFRGNGPPGGPARFMVNNGKFVDRGGNDYRLYTADDVFTTTIPADCFDGHMPIVNGSWFPYAERAY
jgi:hypothetical protein